MEDMAPFFFDYPSRKMRMIALTGTNGKTTTTHIAAHILHKAGNKVGVIGTIHVIIGIAMIDSNATRSILNI